MSTKNPLQFLNTLKFKLMALALCSLPMILLPVFLYVLPGLESSLLEQKEHEIRIATDLSIGTLERLQNRVESGKLTKEEAQEQARDFLRAYRYFETEYMFAVDQNGVIMVHGLNPAIEGTSRIEAADPKGKKYFREMIEITKAQGEGVVSYMFEKNKGAPPVDKVSYVKLFKAWGWVVGTGVYIEDVEAQVAEIRNHILYGLGGLCLLIGLVGWFFSSSIAKSLIRVTKDLEIGADQVSDVAVKLADSSTSLASTTEEQAAALQETTASLEETSAMVTKNAENASNSLSVATASAQDVEEGRKAIDEMNQAMKEITSANGQIADEFHRSFNEIGDIVRIINEIESKTRVINEIVFQTKLLSFNASVEAARAGDSGKGFAVVAEEIGNLAKLSGQSAEEISRLLMENTAKIHDTIESSKGRFLKTVDSAKSKVDFGTQKAEKSSQIFQKITKSVELILHMISEISAASEEQSKGIAEINKAMMNLEEASQRTQLTSGESALSAQTLEKQVVALREHTHDLHNTVWGRAA